jgi:hypothetical protein
MSKQICRLTKRIVEAAAPTLERYTIWDTELKGFGLRVEPAGKAHRADAGEIYRQRPRFRKARRRK